MPEQEQSGAPGPENPQALHGVRVIDASSIVAGPLCCQILGDYGADVIKIEHPVNGDSLRGHGYQHEGVPLWWKEIGRNKRTIGLNLGQPEGAKVFLRLAATADVVVENFRPGTLERWGIGPQQLHEVNPDLVLLRLTGFGQSGPYASRPGFGTLAEAMSGFAHMTGEADGPPTLPSFGLADSICALAGAAAVTMALRHREVGGGRGQVIDLSILAPMMTAVGPAPTVYGAAGIIESRHGNRSTNNAPRNTYRTRDGSWVAVSTSAQAIAERVLALVGHPEVTTEPWFKSGHGRADHVDLLDAYVGDWIAARDRDEVLRAFTEADAAIAPVYNAKDIVEDAHVRKTEMLVEVPDEDLGSILMHNVLWGMSETPGRIRFTGRRLGADTDAVLAGELGLEPEAVERLRRQGVVA
ncbi:MAG TPA: CoA transferase [Trebonia sp.]|jgi:crotonobetainyl-CoA:carnitine CoA-transferase CaiB-like acyl-CoA transferase